MIVPLDVVTSHAPPAPYFLLGACEFVGVIKPDTVGMALLASGFAHVRRQHGMIPILLRRMRVGLGQRGTLSVVARRATKLFGRMLLEVFVHARVRSEWLRRIGELRLVDADMARHATIDADDRILELVGFIVRQHHLIDLDDPLLDGRQTLIKFGNLLRLALYQPCERIDRPLKCVDLVLDRVPSRRLCTNDR